MSERQGGEGGVRKRENNHGRGGPRICKWKARGGEVDDDTVINSQYVYNILEQFLNI